MESALAVLSGCLVAGGVYLLLDRHLVRILFGLVMLSNAVNLIIFSAGGLSHRNPPLIQAGETTLTLPAANALPQALILTAIVIGFALLTFMFIVFYRSYEVLGSADVRKLKETASTDLDHPAAAETKETPS